MSSKPNGEDNDTNRAGTYIDLALVANLAREAETAKAKILTMGEIAERYVDPDKLIVVRDGQKLDLSEALLKPEQISQVHTEPASFVAALKRWGRRDMTVQFLHPKNAEVVAYLDYHEDRTHIARALNFRRAELENAVKAKVQRTATEAATPEENGPPDSAKKDALGELIRAAMQQTPLPADTRSWSLDRIERRAAPREVIKLNLQRSEEWNAWMRLNGQEIKQELFAAFIEQNVGDIQADGGEYPTGNAFLRVALELEGRRDVEWQASTDLQTGDRKLVWKEATGAKGGQSVPRRLRVVLRPFIGFEARAYTATVAFRANASGVTFKLEFQKLETIDNLVRTELAERLAQETGYPVYAGCLT